MAIAEPALAPIPVTTRAREYRLRRGFAIGGILLLSSFFNFYRIASAPRGLFFDAAAYANDAVIANKTGQHRVFYTENNGREGLFINLESAVFRVAPIRPWAPMALSAAVGVGTTLGLYSLANLLWGHRVALLASFLLAVNFWHVALSRMALRAVLASFFTAWSLYLLLRAFREVKERRALWFAILAGAVYGLGWHSYISFRATVLLIGAVMALEARSRDRRPGLSRKLGAFAAAALLAFLPIGIYFLANPKAFTNRIMQSLPATHSFLRETIKDFVLYPLMGNWEWLYGSASPRYLAIPLIFLAVAGVIWMARNGERREIVITAGLFLTGLLPGVISGAPFHSLRSEICLLPICAVSAIGLLYLASFATPRRRSAMTAAVLAVLAVQGYCGYFVDWARRPMTETYLRRDCIDTAEAINRLPERIPKVVIFDSDWPIVMGTPAPAMIISLLTDTTMPAEREKKHIRYVHRGGASRYPGSIVFHLR